MDDSFRFKVNDGYEDSELSYTITPDVMQGARSAVSAPEPSGPGRLRADGAVEG